MQLVAARIPASNDGRCPRVGIDGPDGAGKTYFADELAALLRAQRRSVVRVSLDDFHNTRDVRYRRGRDSPEGFWADSYNYERFHIDVIAPFSPGGSRTYRTAAHDLATDAILNPVPRSAAPGTVLIVDGIFLHRNEFAATWTCPSSSMFHLLKRLGGWLNETEPTRILNIPACDATSKHSGGTSENARRSSGQRY